MDANAPKSDEKFEALVAEMTSHVAAKVGSPLRVAAPAPAAPGKVAGPIGDAILVPTAKIMAQLVADHGPQAVTAMFDFLRTKIPF